MDLLNKTQLELLDWLNNQLRYNNVPRLVDVLTFVQNQGMQLNKKQVSQVMRLQSQYKGNMRQQRMAGKSRMYRPVVVSELGHWHADIGFPKINRRYEMPVSFRAGYLIAKDILSRKVYVTPLIKNRTADSIITGFKKLLLEHKQIHPNVLVKSIAFDRETSVLSKKVQTFFKDQNIAFHAFKLSSSKAKFAEGAIRQVREVMQRLMERGINKDRWWNLLPTVVDILNNQEIVVNGKKLGLTPNQVTLETVGQFKRKLHKAVPAYYFAQFDIAPKLVSFIYTIGSLVRAKLIATSSDVIGNKRSEINLTNDVFVIEDKVPYVTRKMTVGKAYKCRNIKTNEVEIFQEDEITLTNLDGDDADWRSQPTIEEL